MKKIIILIPVFNDWESLEKLFVEINKNGLMIYPDQPLWKETKPRVIPSASIPNDGALKRLLDAVLGDEDAIVTFLMRSDGLNVYNAVRTRVETFQKK